MCGRYVLKREDLEALVKEFGLRSLDEFHSRFNIAPTSVVPAIRNGPSGSPELSEVRWGLVPSWTKQEASPKPLVNVRAETLSTRFRAAFRGRRCILPASGFFEWKAEGSRKQPWYFAAAGGDPIGLAGIWETWAMSGGFRIETCAIITTAPNALVSPIHNRMPVVLSRTQCRAWLESEPNGEDSQKALLVPAPERALTASRVAEAVNSVRNDGPECIEPAPAARPDQPDSQLSLGL